MQKHIFLKNVYIILSVVSLALSLYSIFEHKSSIAIVPLVAATILAFVHHSIYKNNKQNKVVSILMFFTFLSWAGVILTLGMYVICSGVGCYLVVPPMLATFVSVAITVFIGLISFGTKSHTE